MVWCRLKRVDNNSVTRKISIFVFSLYKGHILFDNFKLQEVLVSLLNLFVAFPSHVNYSNVYH